MRAAMKPGWEDLVRRCIQKFHAQHEGESLSYAKRHHHEGKRLQRIVFLNLILLNCYFLRELSLKLTSQTWVWLLLVSVCARPRKPCLLKEVFTGVTIGQESGMRDIDLDMMISRNR